MRWAMGSILTLSACGSGSVALKGGVGEAGADTGVTDAGDSADTADTADSGDSGDSGEHAIHSYIGTLDGAVDLSSSVGLVTCSGTFSIAWDADLRFSGDGTCTGDAGAFAGTISGGVAG